MSVTLDPRNLSIDELDLDIALARSRAAHHIARCGRDEHGTPRCAYGRDALAEQDELLEVRFQRG